MRKKRIFLGLLLVIALLAFAGCSNDGDTIDPDTPDNVTQDRNDTLTDDINDGVNDVTDDLNNAADNVIDGAEDTVDDLVTTDGAMNNNHNNNL